MDAPRTAPLPSDAVTTIVTVLPALTAVLKSRGIDPDVVFAEAHVARPAEGSPLIRISVAELERIWAAASRVTGDGALGIEAALRLRPTSFHALGYSLQASRDLRDFGARLSRYFRFVAEAANFELIESIDDVLLEGRPRIAHIPPESEDAFCGFIVRFIADLSEGACHPRAIRMLRPAPPTAERRTVRYWGVPLNSVPAPTRSAFRAGQRRDPLRRRVTSWPTTPIAW